MSKKNSRTISIFSEGTVFGHFERQDFEILDKDLVLIVEAHNTKENAEQLEPTPENGMKLLQRVADMDYNSFRKEYRTDRKATSHTFSELSLDDNDFDENLNESTAFDPTIAPLLEKCDHKLKLEIIDQFFKKELTKKQAVVYLMVEILGLKKIEVAKRLGISSAAVCAHYRKARERIQEKISTQEVN